MTERAESLLISSGGRLRGCVFGSILLRRNEDDLPRSEEALEKCREERFGSAAAVAEAAVGAAGEAGLADFFVDEDEADFDLCSGLTGDLVGEGSSE